MQYYEDRLADELVGAAGDRGRGHPDDPGQVALFSQDDRRDDMTILVARGGQLSRRPAYSPGPLVF